MPRELLKFRPGDSGLKIRKDGTMEIAGVDESGGMIDQNGKVNPALLFAAAWARKDQKVFEALIQNFKDAVLEGYFGPDAQADYKKALKLQPKKETKEPVASSMKEIKEDETPAVDEKVEYKQPKPLTEQEAVNRRDT